MSVSDLVTLLDEFKGLLIAVAVLITALKK